MSKKVKSLLVNLGLSFISLLICMLFLEFIVFRFFLLASDIPKPDFAADIVRHQAGQEGFYRLKNEIEANFRINSNGWNSGHEEYKTTKDSNTYRIAIIGDSYIEALQVDYNKSVAERLESNLGNSHFQVYRFGISGAPLSQYLHMLRKEALRYNPDLVIINLVHNDFDESYEFQPGIYTSSFMKLEIVNNAITDELKPRPFKTPWYNWIRESATWGYLAYRQQIRFQMLRNIFLGGGETKSKFRANIDVSLVDQKAHNNQLATDYLFRNIKNICDSNNTDLLILIDGERESINNNAATKELYNEGALKLNTMAALVAEKYHIDFLDLHAVFKDDYSKNKKRFNFKYDGHWNSYAHEVVASTLTEHIRNHLVPNTFEQ